MTELAANKLHAVLFVCSMNAVRSPIAEGLTRLRYGKRVYVDSAGLAKMERDGFALAVLREAGIEFENDEPQTLDEVDCAAFDLVVALSSEAHTRAADLLRTTSVELLFWPIEDATQVTGSREQRIEAYRRVRDSIDLRIRDEIGCRFRD
ncbi:MAG: arsenate [Beijerinckiaceae bacterium]|nr:MAG: arsenate [Beijerinckiaceae bacterium]